MDNWQKFISDIPYDIKSVDELFNSLLPLIRNFGFEYCAYGIEIPVPVTKPRVELVNNYSLAWKSCYSSNNYVARDPSITEGRHSPLPVTWSDELFKPASDLWEDARSHGLNYGWAQFCRSSNNVNGMLTLSRSHEPLTDREIEQNGYKFIQLAHYIHGRMSYLFCQTHVPEANITLTPREKAVLLWTAEGKTSSEISIIIGIAERTVNFHINNINTKLGTTNKISSAVKASMLGLLS